MTYRGLLYLLRESRKRRRRESLGSLKCSLDTLEHLSEVVQSFEVWRFLVRRIVFGPRVQPTL